MNKQTRRLFSVNLATRVIKGAQVPKEGKSGIGSSLAIQERPRVKGVAVNSSKERADSGRKAWKGAGNPLGR